MPVEQIVNGNQKLFLPGSVPSPMFGKVINGGVAVTLGLEDHGATVMFNTAAGFTVTLPTPAKGLKFFFQVTTTVTSVAAKILTPASTYLLGHFVQSTDGTFVEAYHAANGTTIRSWSGDGAATGGLIGDYFQLTGINSTQYLFWGQGSATGSEATPFGTS